MDALKQLERSFEEQGCIEQLEKFFEEHGYVEVGYFTNPSYISAIVGISQDERLVYDYDEMIKYLMETDGMTYEDAMEFIDYNTERTIPYMGDKAPIILHHLDMVEQNTLS
jgi:hypothetical protein